METERILGQMEVFTMVSSKMDDVMVLENFCRRPASYMKGVGITA